MIGYDLVEPRQNYDELIEAIKNLGNWWHCLDSTWLLKTGLSAVQIRDALSPFVDSNDLLLVSQVAGDAAWEGFSKDCSDWLRNNL